MLGRIEHVALAVADLNEAIDFYRDTWGLDVTHRERIEAEGVEEAVLPLGESNIQLVSPIHSDSTVARWLERRGEGLHHIAFEVDDLEATLQDLKSRGAQLIDEHPRTGGGGHQVAFVHPKGNHGLLVELVQRPQQG